MSYSSINGRVAVFGSEKQLEDALNDSTLPSLWGVKYGKGGFTWAGFDGEIISEEAQDVLDNMPTPLAGTERDAVIAFVNSQSVDLGDGNWALMDSHVFFALTAVNNSVWDVIRKVAMTPVAAPTHTPGTGYAFNGTNQYIDSGFNPSVDGVNYKLSDALMGVFCVSPPSSTFDYLAGAIMPASAGVKINTGNPVTITSVSVNSNSANVNSKPIVANQLNVVTSVAVDVANLYQNAVLEGSPAIITDVLPLVVLYIGAVNNSGTASNFGAETLSSFIAGAAIGFDHTSYYDNLVILNAAL